MSGMQVSQKQTAPLRLPEVSQRPRPATVTATGLKLLDGPCLDPKDGCQLESGKSASTKLCIDFLSGPQPKSFYINGIRTPEASAREAQRELESISGGKIELIYNKTDGLISDTIEAVSNLSGVDTDIARQTRARFRTALDQGEPIRIFAHSQGAAIAAEALCELKDDWRKEGVSEQDIKARLGRVEVVGFGGFIIESRFPKEVKVDLHRQHKDYIPKFAEAICELQDAAKSKEADFLPKLGKFGKTVGGFVAVNSAQAFQFVMGRRTPAQTGTTGKSLIEDLGKVCNAVGKAVGSDHNMIVKEGFIRQEFSAGYLDNYRKDIQVAKHIAVKPDASGAALA